MNYILQSENVRKWLQKSQNWTSNLSEKEADGWMTQNDYYIYLFLKHYQGNEWSVDIATKIVDTINNKLAKRDGVCSVASQFVKVPHINYMYTLDYATGSTKLCC